MNILAAGFWGAYFGTAALMLVASLAIYVRSRQRVALTAALSAVFCVVFVVAFLGLLPIADPQAEARMLAHVATVCATSLSLMLLALLGLLRQPGFGQRVAAGVVVLALVVVVAGLQSEPIAALALGASLAVAFGVVALILSVRSARRGDRLAWVAVSGIACMLIALLGLSWIALDRDHVPWLVHVGSAVASMVFLALIASAMWSRYSYLIEVREVMAHGPSYDPVTRMRSHAETGQLVGAVFARHEGDTRPVGVIVVSICNLYTLENLHGRAAINHALFLCASRLRRCVPVEVEMGRLAEDGFLLLMRNCDDPKRLIRLIRLSRLIAARLARPVALKTAEDAAQPDGGRTQWVADVGVGVLQALPQVRAASAVGMARAMSRTAWTYPSRVAWYDHSIEQIAELPGGEGS